MHMNLVGQVASSQPQCSLAALHDRLHHMVLHQDIGDDSDRNGGESCKRQLSRICQSTFQPGE
jgi:hypothetical protein